jgi:hypothetical protein
VGDMNEGGRFILLRYCVAATLVFGGRRSDLDGRPRYSASAFLTVIPPRNSQAEDRQHRKSQDYG